ncbi:MAG: hypothetical protein ACYS8W_06055 [Planctomycetota bacterium]|jgi:hypothetical protein
MAPGGGAAGGMGGGGGSFGGSDMLSGLGDDRVRFITSLDYSVAESGKTAYRSYSVSLKYLPFRWLILSASVPYQSISGFDTRWETYTDAFSNPVTKYEEFHYNQEGVGDISVMAWINLAYPFYKKPAPPCPLEKTPQSGEKPESRGPIKRQKDAPDSNKKSNGKDKNPLEGFGEPVVLFGIGLKLDTGKHDVWDYQKYVYDRSISEDLTGEYSITDGIIPASYQLGTGTTDILTGIYYQQRFGRFVPTASLVYQLTGGENSVGYERSDKVSWNLSTKYILNVMGNNRQFCINGGLSGSITTSADTDHSENTMMLGIQELGEIPDSDADYKFWDIGLSYDFTPSISAKAGFKFPLGSSEGTTENAFDKLFSLGITFRF